MYNFIKLLYYIWENYKKMEKKRGGKREGSGRKKSLLKSKRIYFQVPLSLENDIKELVKSVIKHNK